MTLAIILTLSLSATGAIVATNIAGVLVGSLVFIVAPITSLDFWVLHKIFGFGPSNFIPNWMAGSMVLLATALVVLYIWSSHSKERGQEEVSK